MYKSVKEFRKHDKSGYEIICKRGLKKKLCSHLTRMSNTWTEEELAAAASKYDSLKEFRENNLGAYRAICTRGLMDKFCGHMSRAVRPPLSDEDLIEIASKYDTLSDFMEKERHIYSKLCMRGLSKKACKHMKRECRAKYSDEELAAIAAGYDDLTEFQEKEPSVFQIVFRRGLTDKLCGHMERHIKVFSDEELAEIASKYNTRGEFAGCDRQAYYAATRRGILDKICQHMEPVGNWFKRKIYSFTFSDGYAYIGLAQDPERRYVEHTQKEKKSPVFKHIKETGLKPEYKLLTDWLHKDVAGKVEDGYIKKYATEGWKMLNRANGGALGSIHKNYTPEYLQREADKYDYYEDFRKNSRIVYNYLVRNHALDRFCSHMKHRDIPKRR